MFTFRFFGKMSFFTTKGHSITQTWGGLGNQTGIEQPTKWSSLRKDLAVLAKESEIWFYAHGMWVILKSGKHICKLSILSSFVAKIGQSCGSLSMAIKSLQSVPRLWHIEYYIMLSISHLNASTSKCRGDSLRV